LSKTGKDPTDYMEVVKTAKKHKTLTVQAEYVRPFLVSFQHPPLLIPHLPDPEATITKSTCYNSESSLTTNIQQSYYGIPILLTYKKRKCQKMNPTAL
jgi:hypothetical protein